MFSGRFQLIPLLVAVSLAFNSGVELANSGTFTPCTSEASAPAGLIFGCPGGDGETLGGNGLVISVTVRNGNNPVPGIPAFDIWVNGCSDMLPLCNTNGGVGAAAPTDANGQTTIVGGLPAGGCDLAGIFVVVQGIRVGCDLRCLPIKIKTPDLNGSQSVNLADFSTFGAGYTSPPKAYNECIDIAAPFGTVTLIDFAKFAPHMGHSC